MAYGAGTSPRRAAELPGRCRHACPWPKDTAYIFLGNQSGPRAAVMRGTPEGSRARALSRCDACTRAQVAREISRVMPVGWAPDFRGEDQLAAQTLASSFASGRSRRQERAWALPFAASEAAFALANLRRYIRGGRDDSPVLETQHSPGETSCDHCSASSACSARPR